MCMSLRFEVRACAARVARNRCTAWVWWMFLSSCRVLEPETFRHSRGASGSMGRALHRFSAAAMDVRSLRARVVIALSVSASRRRTPSRVVVTRSRVCRCFSSW